MTDRTGRLETTSGIIYSDGGGGGRNRAEVHYTHAYLFQSKSCDVEGRSTNII